MNTETIDTTTAAEMPFETVRRRLLGADGSITHAGNIGYTFGGGGMGLLARRYGMAAGSREASPPGDAAHRPNKG